jgi:phage tail tape-measure protein
MSRARQTIDQKRHPDPITNAPDSHPVGTGVGAGAGGAIGAAMGSPGGPAVAAAGAAIGAMAGGLLGKGVAEGIDAGEEHRYWRENFSSRPYVQRDHTYEEYGPAYQHGWESYSRHVGRTFNEAEVDMAKEWRLVKRKSRLKWEQAKEAARDAWNRVANAQGKK